MKTLEEKEVEELKSIIEKSNLFDRNFYLMNNRDVRITDLAPITHYINFGIKEDRSPNKDFDPIWYRKYYLDTKENKEYPFIHFIRFGRKENRYLNEAEKNEYERLEEDSFDIAFYKNNYEDLKLINDENFDFLLHYIRDGKKRKNLLVEYRQTEDAIKENNSINNEALQEYNILRESEYFDIEYYLAVYVDVRDANLDPIQHYLDNGAKEGRNPSSKFDTRFYLETYTDIDINILNPLIHYILYGKQENRIVQALPNAIIQKKVNFSDYDMSEYTEIKKMKLDWSNYFTDNNHDFLSNNPIKDYIKNWKNCEPLVSNYFDTEFYLSSYPDIRDSNSNPLIHFFNYGTKEGRLGLLDSNLIENGNLKYNPDKENIVFVSHESSATGAPLLGYAIADELSEKYNIIHIVLKKANIHDSFLNNCDLILHDIQASAYTSSYFFLKQLLKTRSIKCMIINSIVGYETMDAGYKLHIPIVFLIHEFAEYMRPFGTMIDAVTHSNHVVIPATIIQDSILKEFKRFSNYSHIPSNMKILPQGKLPYIRNSYGDDDSVDDLYKKLKINSSDDVKIIVGSGWVQIRKGVDLFIAVSRYIKKLYSGKCKFIWVGEGFDPDDDLSFSVYLDREIEFSGLKDDFTFLEHQKNLDTIFSISDVFCLASRMDPFPNVVIDALKHDLHIACFNHASGSAEFLASHNANCTIVDFVDTYALAEGISKYLVDGNTKKGINNQILDEHLNFNKYVNELDLLINKATLFQKESDFIVKTLLESGEFDADFYSNKGTIQEKCRTYVENGLKGIHFHNPKIGFSEIDWMEKNSKDNYSIVPLYEALKSRKIDTHEVVILPNENKIQVNFKYAVHLHLYYTDMASYFATFFSNLPNSFDLYITIVNEKEKIEVEKQFILCGASKIKVVCVENIGRDMAPLLFGLKDEILNGNYDVIGHFHSKRSLDLETGGDKWLEYLMQHLIGDPDDIQSILNIFNNPSIGLVFPEDTNTSDIGENKEYVTNLCNMLKMPIIEQTSIFPIGNMFWARVDALKELFELDKNSILQPEPLPYDGSYMHAIERITPYLSQKNGYRYVTLYKKGLLWK